MKPSRRFMARASLATLPRLAGYFAGPDRTADALLNVAVALRYWSETVLYTTSFGRPPNYVNPEGFTEKIQWRKVFDRNPELVTWCDKLAARRLARRRVPEIAAPRLLWEGTDPDEIPLESLEPPFVVKVNNRSGALRLVRDAADLDVPAIRAACRRWMDAPAHRRRAGEWGYGRVPSRIYVEEFLSNGGGTRPPPDLKIFVFHGKAAYLYHRDPVAGELRIHDPAWNRYDWDRYQRIDRVDRVPFLADVPPPAGLEAVIGIAERIAAGIDFLRVDLYVVGGTVYFGETTVYPSSGNKMWIRHDDPADPHPSNDVDLAIGRHWDTPRPRPMTVLRRLLGRT